jgi:tetratricopeptide (TPR) repeat protein
MEKPRFPGALPPIWNVPHLRNQNFTGRESLLADLRSVLTSGQHVALHGLGGMGKTQLAVQYAYSHMADYGVVWWIRSEESATLASDYADLASDLDLPKMDDQRDTVRAVRLWLGRNKDWLLVFDNADNPNDIRDYLPQGGRGHMIITSRDSTDWGSTATALEVKKFDRVESIEFLHKRTKQEDEDAADAMAEELGGLPLALEQAGAYILAKVIRLGDYLELFRTRRKELWKDEKTPANYRDKVDTTWNLAMDQVKEEAPEGADLLNLCAFLAPDDVPRSLFGIEYAHLPESLADQLAVNRAVDGLRRYSLIDANPESLLVHRLVQAVTRDRLSDNERKGWAKAAVKLMNGAFPFQSNDIRTWPECSLLLPHALGAAEYAERLEVAPKATQHLLNRAGMYLMVHAEFGEAKALYKRALTIAENVFGRDHDAVATIINNLGLVLQDMGDLEGAKKCFERALKIGEKLYGPDHPQVAIYTNNLGLVLHDIGNLESAKKYYEWALTIGEKVYAPDHSQLAIYVNNLGRVLRAQGDFEGAKEKFERALEIGEKTYGSDHPQVAIYVNNLGEVLQAQGDFEGAKRYLERALEIDEKALGPDHPKVAVDVNNLGSVLNDMRDLDSAKRYLERALEIGEKVYGPDHPQVAIYVNTFGMVLRNQRDLRGAKKCFERALKIGEKLYGPDHPQVAIYVNNLGLVLQEMDDLEGAKKCYERALRIFRKKLGEDHPNTVKVGNNLNSLGRKPRN